MTARAWGRAAGRALELAAGTAAFLGALGAILGGGWVLLGS